MQKNKNKGFTLVELLLVMAIVGILAGVIFVSVGNQRKKAKLSTALQNAKGIHAIAQECFFRLGQVELPDDSQVPGNEVCQYSKTIWPEITVDECEYPVVGGTSDHYYEIECPVYGKKVQCGIRSGEKCEII